MTRFENNLHLSCMLVLMINDNSYDCKPKSHTNYQVHTLRNIKHIRIHLNYTLAEFAIDPTPFKRVSFVFTSQRSASWESNAHYVRLWFCQIISAITKKKLDYDRHNTIRHMQLLCLTTLALLCVVMATPRAKRWRRV